MGNVGLELRYRSQYLDRPKMPIILAPPSTKLKLNPNPPKDGLGDSP